jgi:hypothetical protein
VLAASRVPVSYTYTVVLSAISRDLGDGLVFSGDDDPCVASIGSSSLGAELWREIRQEGIGFVCSARFLVALWRAAVVAPARDRRRWAVGRGWICFEGLVGSRAPNPGSALGIMVLIDSDSLLAHAVAELLIVYDVKRHHKFFDSIIMVAIKVQF